MEHWTRAGRSLSLAFLILVGVFGLVPVRTAAAYTPNERWCPPQTAYCAEGAFLAFWRANGGLEIIGYPIDHPRRSPSGLIVQYYERAIMEWHPENGPDYQVLLSRLGAALAESSPARRVPPAACAADCSLMAQTNHTLRGPFLRHWNSHGGLPVYGFPLTEEYRETNAADGKTYTVQYFERNRFEYHPEHAGTRYEILLGRLGAEVFAARAAEIAAWPVVKTPRYAATRQEALLLTATALVDGVPDLRYVTDTLAAKKVSTVFDAGLPADTTGGYNFRTNTIVLSPALLSQDPHALAIVLAHEGQHAYDYLTYGPPRSTGACYAFEFRGFLAEAALWAAWWGPEGKPNPSTDFERAENAILDDILNNQGREIQRFIASAYAAECAAPNPAHMADAGWRTTLAQPPVAAFTRDAATGGAAAPPPRR